MNHVWDVVVHQQPFEKGLGRLTVSVRLQQDIEHRAGFIDSPPQPEFLPHHVETDLIQGPPGTPEGFPVAQRLGEKRRELNVPLAKGFVEEWRPHGRPFTTMADDNTALVQQFLDITFAQGEPVVEPEGVPDDAERKTVSVGFAVSHKPSA
ncbi:hypothetical protein HNQ08_002753 [Deinococcus humi]|uniref:Uncharacterized protein n=1 Tax=Deinococcus humi TaxID=662880 RepID=A0A7W8NH57_9DEIO|nr:hypothetical protein [Deinococcus humi]GGO29916.1 hypothetical protein GCM10008949_24070 [Deinococcus humi]